MIDRGYGQRRKGDLKTISSVLGSALGDDQSDIRLIGDGQDKTPCQFRIVNWVYVLEGGPWKTYVS